MPSEIPTTYASTEHSHQESSETPSSDTYTDSTTPREKKDQTCIKNFQSKILKFGTGLARFKLELVIFLYAFSQTMTSVSSTTMIIDKVCLINLNYSSYICENLQNDNFTTIKSSVEKLANNYQLGHSLIQTAPAAVLACFIGPWSDHYGRKFPILLALFGLLLDSLGSTVCAYYMESRVEYFFIPAIFTGLFGGPIAILAIIYSYASDLTSQVERIIKFGFLDMASGFAMSIGGMAGGWIYKFMGYPAVYIISAGGLSLTLVLVVLLLKETRGLDNKDPWSVKMKKLFSCESFIEGFRAAAKERPLQGRKQILLLIASTCFLYSAINSTGDINYLYVLHQFGWSNTTYSTINAIYTALTIVLIVMLIPLMRHYKLGDPILGLIGVISLIGKNIGIGLTFKTAIIYHIANLLGLLFGLSIFAARARVSKLVAKEDLGKVFVFVATAESLFPILTSVMMSQIFKATLDIFAGTPYIIQACFLLMPLAVFGWMCTLPKISFEDVNRINSELDDPTYSDIS